MRNCWMWKYAIAVTVSMHPSLHGGPKWIFIIYPNNEHICLIFMLLLSFSVCFLVFSHDAHSGQIAISWAPMFKRNRKFNPSSNIWFRKQKLVFTENVLFSSAYISTKKENNDTDELIVNVDSCVQCTQREPTDEFITKIKIIEHKRKMKNVKKIVVFTRFPYSFS